MPFNIILYSINNLNKFINLTIFLCFNDSNSIASLDILYISSAVNSDTSCFLIATSSPERRFFAKKFY